MGKFNTEAAKLRSLREATVKACGDWRALRGEQRQIRHGYTLADLERSLFGCRMPSAVAIINEAGWGRDAIGDFCPRCGTTRAPYEDIRGGCGECRGRALGYQATIRLGRYAPPLSQWVPAIKKRAWRDMGVVLGQALSRQVVDSIAAGHTNRPDVVTSVPVHWLRSLLRGIDHGETIGAEVARGLQLPFIKGLRANLSHRQHGSGRSMRTANSNRFALRPNATDFSGKHILLVDDVRTTGATIGEAMTALNGANPKSVALAVCAVADPPRRNGMLRPELNRIKPPNTPGRSIPRG